MKKERVTQCKWCGSTEFYTKKNGPHIGLYCKSCNKWIKWIPKKYEGNFVEDKIKEAKVDDIDMFDDLPWE